MRIILNMIVRNEKDVIKRCLESVKPLLDRWVIVDTGSTDGTQEFIRECLADVPGTLVEQPWVDFEWNRNQALALAKVDSGPEDYVLFMDADDVLVNEPTTDLTDTWDCYEIEEHDANLRFYRPFIVRANLPLRWVGKTHEYLDGAMTASSTKLTGVYRQRGTKTPEQYKVKLDRDLGILSSSDSDNPRTCFYLAQTLKDLGRLPEAIAIYDKRASLGGWEEERWWALYESAMLHDRLGRAPAAVMYAYLQVYEARPTRAEPLVQLARYCRDRGLHQQAFMFAAAALQIPFPGSDRLFVDGDVYAIRRLDEYAIAAFWTGRYGVSCDACKELLSLTSLPFEDRVRIEKNLSFAAVKLAASRSI